MVRDLNATFRLVRTVVFGIVSSFALIVLGLSASLFDPFGIPFSGLTLLTIPLMLYLSLKRKGAFPSMVVLEVGWTSFLWILWLALGGMTIAFEIGGGCSDWSGGSYDQSICFQVQAMGGIALSTGALLLFYNVGLYVLIIRQHMRGNSHVWRGYINATDFAAAGPDSTVPSNKTTEAGFAPQYQAPAVVPVYQQPQMVAPHQITSPYPQL